MKIFLTTFCVFINILAFSQSNKAIKAHGAIFDKEFSKAKELISDLNKKDKEISLISFLKYEYYVNQYNTEFNIDTAYYYLKFSYDNLQSESEKTTVNYQIEFLFGPPFKETQFNNLFFIFYQIAKKDKSINKYNHFIKEIQKNKYTEVAINELDTLNFELFDSYNSIDSLYSFKKRFKQSKLINKIDEIIVSKRFKLCDLNSTTECYSLILSDFPNTILKESIKSKIKSLEDTLASIDFAKCKIQRSTSCLLQIIENYPNTSLLNKINDEIDEINFEKYIKPKNIDSIAFFIVEFPNSKYIKKVDSLFVDIFEDSLKRLTKNKNWIGNYNYDHGYSYLKNDFYPLIKIYFSINGNDSSIKGLIDDLVYASVINTGGIEGLSWALNEFPNSNKTIDIKNEIKNRNSYSNVGFIRENDIYSKYGLLNMTSRSLNFGYFLNDVKNFSCELAAVRLDAGKWGFINKQGDVVIPFQYDNVRSFKTNITGVCIDGVWFFIDKNGYKISDKEYLEIGEYGDELFNVKQFSGSWQFINSNEQVVGSKKYYNASNFINGLAAVSLVDGVILIIDKEFNVIKDLGGQLIEYIGYGRTIGTSNSNLETFEFCDKINKYLINAKVYYSHLDNSIELLQSSPDAVEFKSNDLKFDQTGDFLIDGRDIINYRSDNYKIDYSLNSGKIDFLFNMNGPGLHPLVNDYYTRTSKDYIHTSIFSINKNSSLFNSINIMAFNDESIIIRNEMGSNLILPNGELLSESSTFGAISVLSNGIAIVNTSAGSYLVDNKGDKISKLFKSIYRINEETFIVSNKDEDNFYLINSKGDELSAHYDVIEKNVFKNNLVVKNKSVKNYYEQKYKIGYINIDGGVVIPPVYDAEGFISTPGHLIFKKNKDTYDIYTYYGEKVETVNGYYYSHTNSKASIFHKNVINPKTGELLKLYVYEVNLF
jgi:hypothetical protein